MTITKQSYIVKWLILGVLIGVVAGASALTFYLVLRLTTYVFMDLLIGYRQPEPIGFGGSLTYTPHIERPWLIPVSTVLGAVIVAYLAREFRESRAGLDAVIEAYHGRRRPFSNPGLHGFMNVLLSAITIGSGGSAGPEAPTGNLGGGLSYLIAEGLGLSDEDRALAMIVGMGAALGAVFKAPVGGALLAAELPYRRDFEVKALYPALVASLTAYAIFCLVTGFKPYMGQVMMTVPTPSIPLYAVLGVVDGAVAMAYVESLDGIHRLFSRLRVNDVVRTAIGGVLIGLIGLIMPQVLGAGEGWMDLAVYVRLSSFSSPIMPLIILLALLPLVKILSTSVTLGSGEVGGVFTPGLVVGAFTGLDMGLLLHYLYPTLVPSAVPFVVVSSLAMFGAASNAPLAVMVMMLEMTNNYRVLPEAVIASTIAYLMTTWKYTVFKAQRAGRTRTGRGERGSWSS
ncbi:chloride channel protein [Vulcanisaeta distributa]|uniref:Cl-channel voltage-gated family protein n=1 Tax=Vulcanisaeta distributa (strain DSM 14429 / JCM 11212 / NBRC 100878 / IC-017) TaxID=572478 RepID=E1QVA7_VULDI|nr:chloride channel protein [Vulcanisaeta distributa]ADN50034.1 Cl- channel voltage-gated family protein [Vulcanisaeta distributa DSM 14429]